MLDRLVFVFLLFKEILVSLPVNTVIPIIHFVFFKTQERGINWLCVRTTSLSSWRKVPLQPSKSSRFCGDELFKIPFTLLAC